MKLSRLIACALAACTLGCGDDNPIAPTEIPGVPITELFIGTLAPGGSSFYSIGFGETSQVRVTLVGLSSSAGVLTPATVSLRMGVPSGTTCAPTSSQNVAPGFAAQIAGEFTAGTYCVGIADAGGLTQSTNFLIRINEIPISSGGPATPAPATENFASNLAVLGTSARTFTATGAGTLGVTLQSIGPPSSTVVDLAIGIPKSDGSGCLIGRLLRGGAGTQITTPVDAGPYCVMLSDFGGLAAPVSFSVAIAKP